MIHDKIQVILQDLNRLKFQLKEIKKELRAEEKLDTNEYEDLKAAYKDLRGQIKGMEEDWEKQLMEDDNYIKMREMRQEKEEEIAEMNGKLFELIGQLPPKPVEMDMESEDGNVLIQIHPDMRIYLNGKEEKRRV